MNNAESVLRQARLALNSLTVFNDIIATGGVFTLLDRLLAAITKPAGDWDEIFKLHHQLAGKVLARSLETPFPVVGSAWQDYLLDSLLLADNYFTRRVEEGSRLPEPVVKSAQADLAALQQLYNLDRFAWEEAIRAGGQIPVEQWNLVPWEKPACVSTEGTSYALQLKQTFQSGLTWDKLLEPLMFYYRTVGTGSFSYCHAFRFLDTEEGPVLKPVLHPDPIRLSHLIGYEAQRQQVVRNTEQFIKGYPANNLLLYGDRGTGKSSTVKALVHEYGERGLRMVEMAKQDLSKLPALLDLIRHRPHRFIIFIDDLSFEEGEVDYKHLKAVLEGSLEARPDNVLIYATSNRRHLIKERFSDRDFNGDGEVRVQDTLQEKLSLADRFGMTIIFTSPDQEQYLAIVQGLARQAGLDVEDGELRQQALRWALWHNGHSGRTARQFIDDLKGRLAMEVGGNH